MPVVTSSPVIQFHFIESSFSLKNRIALKVFLEGIFKKEKKALASLNYIFCSDEYLLNMNRQFLKHDYYTDIITFDLSEKKQPIIGEVYISVDRVKENSKRLKQSFQKELHRVIFHGSLHLCGYKDKKRDEIVTMRAKEAYYLKQYGSALCIAFT
jgi:rRNA maturation RNase YbeY